ncbi:hypothetical protein E2C01_019313 [Portunus trituberculatus]|uniref:Uncharacterized protein n=1 Tax=Portunus trituberculatus TaxID=210409 RepID=A0A5B7DYI9_PORTR|nr:hypothetical protein [Portunus trituberculatus]
MCLRIHFLARADERTQLFFFFFYNVAASCRGWRRSASRDAVSLREEPPRGLAAGGRTVGVED